MAAPGTPSSHRDATFNCRVVGDRAVLAVAGEIDINTAPDLAAAILDAIGAGSAAVWLDFTATTFMDSSGVHVLLTESRRAEALNRHLAIICPPGPVRRLFEIAGVLDWLPVFEDRTAADRAA